MSTYNMFLGRNKKNIFLIPRLIWSYENPIQFTVKIMKIIIIPDKIFFQSESTIFTLVQVLGHLIHLSYLS